ncbi:hypothetical protein LVB77_09850 [Lysobacter sp. 5GHs7-4]|uniref:hypothetical protein n=1 Tax=Lysobacter sp. 5GHs7-4 TaxID=2904253 RepID=UPI001E5C15A6|nr:hypothetical protein [Lysobacter sp. 5GHs7-4]UHQ24946.1 hypothetical protein LVB77_09850 [Lysobacter sp. 5GHs7-4]
MRLTNPCSKNPRRGFSFDTPRYAPTTTRICALDTAQLHLAQAQNDSEIFQDDE